MNDIAIRAERLSKSYKLYDAPKYRLLDMLGLSRQAMSGMREHRALSDLTFDIRCGEKVAIIGRNGAGKSTLLKLVTKVITPSSGLLDIRGETQALLSIGTGFHPEFTGRQNATAYLSSLGFSGAELERMVAEAIAFAEIDDFADQPAKTYSTGMGMRLMFAAATMIRPELLVIDEVLGVGDAYFQQKSYQHIGEICRAKQTTLLLVTHDVYSAAQICDRMMWIDKGRLLIDADPETVLRAYQDSIREQEEHRLRAKALSLRRGEQNANTSTRVLVDIQAANNVAQPSPLYISRLSLLVGGVQVASAPLGAGAIDAEGAFLVKEGSVWGEPTQWEGRLARPMLNYSSPFHKVTTAFDVPLRPGDQERLSVRVEHWSHSPGDFYLRIHGEGIEKVLGALPIDHGRWMDETVGLSATAGAAEGTARAKGTPLASVAATKERLTIAPPEGGAPTPEGNVASGEQGSAEGRADDNPLGIPRSIAPSVNITGTYGAGDIELLGLRIIGKDERERHVFSVGEAVTFAIDYRIRRPGLKEKLHIVLAFRRDGVTDVMRLFADDLMFDAATKPAGAAMAHFKRLPLGPGQYSITVLLAREGYYSVYQTQFFSMNPGVYAAQIGLSEMTIEGTSQLYAGTGVVVDADWSLAWTLMGGKAQIPSLRPMISPRRPRPARGWRLKPRKTANWSTIQPR
ncbi:ABC-type polysaccharide/polyol phosphate transport system ATPase subunit [Bradyrhizobium sp. LB7.2]